MLKKLEYDTYYGRVAVDRDIYFNSKKLKEFENNITKDCEALESIVLGDNVERASVTYNIDWDEYEETECSGALQIYFYYLFDDIDEYSSSVLANDFANKIENKLEDITILKFIANVILREKDIIEEYIEDVCD